MTGFIQCRAGMLVDNVANRSDHISFIITDLLSYSTFYLGGMSYFS